MTVDGADVARERQAAALSTAEKYSGRTKTWIAAELHLSYDQYGRYVSGATPIRVEQIDQFARAYSVDRMTLALAILTGETEPLVWTIEKALRGRVPEDMIPDVVERYSAFDTLTQRAAVEAILEMNAEVIAERTLKPREQAS